MAKQSREDRLNRLNKGQCPIHGVLMVEIEQTVVEVQCKHCKNTELHYGIFTVTCPRKDCNVIAFSNQPEGAAMLAANFEYLLQYTWNTNCVEHSQLFEHRTSLCSFAYNWHGRIRTHDRLINSQLPYLLATCQFNLAQGSGFCHSALVC